MNCIFGKLHQVDTSLLIARQWQEIYHHRYPFFHKSWHAMPEDRLTKRHRAHYRKHQSVCYMLRQTYDAPISCLYPVLILRLLALYSSFPHSETARIFDELHGLHHQEMGMTWRVAQHDSCAHQDVVPR